MGHWANSREYKAARRLRDAAVSRATAAGLRVGVLCAPEYLASDLVWDSLTFLHERRGIRELLIVDEMARWAELERWGGWFRVRSTFCSMAILLDLKPDGVVAFGCGQVVREWLMGRVPVWTPRRARIPSPPS
jgi:hypothetical protein